MFIYLLIIMISMSKRMNDCEYFISEGCERKYGWKYLITGDHHIVNYYYYSIIKNNKKICEWNETRFRWIGDQDEDTNDVTTSFFM